MQVLKKILLWSYSRILLKAVLSLDNFFAWIWARSHCRLLCLFICTSIVNVDLQAVSLCEWLKDSEKRQQAKVWIIHVFPWVAKVGYVLTCHWKLFVWKSLINCRYKHPCIIIRCDIVVQTSVKWLSLNAVWFIFSAQFAGLLCEEEGNGADNVQYCGYCKYHFNKLVCIY